MNKRVISFILLAVMIVTLNLPPAHAKISFTDVDEKKYGWALEAINFMTDNGILTGYPDGSFKPQNPVSKAEFTVMVSRLFDKYRPNTLPEPRNSKFSDFYFEATNIKGYADISPQHWAYKEIMGIYDSRFTIFEFNSNSDGEWLFEPDHFLSRLETARLLSICFDEMFDPNIEDGKLLNILSEIKDINVVVIESGDDMKTYWNEWEKIHDNDLSVYDHVTDYLLLFKMGWIQEDRQLHSGDFPDYEVAKTIANFHMQGIITSGDDKRFRPNDTLSRAEIVTILYRIYNSMLLNDTLSTYSTILKNPVKRY